MLRCQPELKQTEVNRLYSTLEGGGELYLLTPSLRECQGAFRQWPLTFYWFHHMLRRTGNWLLTNCVSAANRMVTNQNGGGVGANDAAWQEDNSVLWQYWRVALLYIIIITLNAQGTHEGKNLLILKACKLLVQSLEKTAAVTEHFPHAVVMKPC